MSKEMTKTVVNPVGATSSRPCFEGKTQKQNDKGITLIALIITIIVMLILVGVTVTVALNGGLFSSAETAASETKIEAEKEKLLSIALGALNNEGKVEEDEELISILADKGFNRITDRTYKSEETGKTYVIGERGSVTEESDGTGGDSGDNPLDGESGTGVTLTWTHADANSNEIFDVGEVVTASNGESFYVIATPEANAETVKLLAAKCVDTREEIDGETNPNYNKQSDNYNTVVFDAETNVYENASIKGLVENYVTETLGLTAKDGMLMSDAEAEALESEHENILYGTTTKWNYWLGSPGGGMTFLAWFVSGDENNMDFNIVSDDGDYGLRPVIEISKSAI